MDLVVRGSAVVVLPMSRWALEVRGSIVAVVLMNRWALEVRGSTVAVVPMNRWVENLGTSAASEVLLAFSPTEVEHLALLKAAATSGKRKKKTYVPLDVKSAKQPDGPNGTKFFSITLLTPLSKDETTTLDVLYMLTRSLEPFPVEISQSESQLVYFRDSAILLSPYHVKQQTTFLKTPSTMVESFTVVDPTKRAGTELKYGPYENHPPYSYSPGSFSLHLQ
ncbi:dolichyl-diphosphooligosaccharide--protein glycosyltransferase subunit 1B-like [Vigna unguiculata]|uniref:dolichyl-diphosphooligosaccharide--protein glycosyltransferase subunit 1B-like n=1 Tax=Vigna unguiculata TaxID=3917 RepID=UPI00101710D3|nr:dolichyl-diphosphooligosaccharide--protein glycosyltransferase subunit 1B-like [Vigna unguiculata]